MISPLAEPVRGEIWRAQFDPVIGHEQGGQRPCFIVSDNWLNSSRAQLVIVIPITRTMRGVPTHVRVDPPEGGLKSTSFVTCEDVRSISKLRLLSRWGVVSELTVGAVEVQLRRLMKL